MFPGELIPLTVPEVRRLLCRLLWLPRGSPNADHPMVRLETAPPGPCHAVSLQETLSGTFTTACATCNTRDETDKAKSIAAWQKLFGEDFKLRSNSNAGQDRNAGSSSGPGANAGTQQRATQASGASASVLVQPRKQYGGVLEGIGSRVVAREVSPVDLEQLAERHSQLAYDAETNVLSGNLRVQASYRPGRGLNINIPRREGDRMHVEDDFAIEIQLTHGKSALAPWPPVYETSGRAQQIMGEQGVGIADLHFFDDRADVNQCCLSLQNTGEWRGIIPFIDELVAPFFYRLAYAARYGVERAESDLWGTYHHRDGFEGAKRQYEADC